MWVMDDKSGSLLANTGDSAYMGDPLIIATASFSEMLAEDLFLNIPLTVVNNCCWQNVLKETKLHIFCCLATADSIPISVLPTNCSKVQ